MRKLSVSTLVTVDGVIQDPGGFGETEQGGWANPYFNDETQRDAIPKLVASTTLTGPLDWNATLIKGDVPAGDQDHADARVYES